MVSADCLYLAQDYVLAEKAYAAIQNETQGADIAYTAFHQRVLSLLSSSDDFKVWTQTTEIIEQAFQNKKVVSSRLWIATWCLLEDIRKANQPDIALQLLERLTPVTSKASIDFQLRFKWQRALITLANRDNIKAAKLADEIAASLERLPADAPAPTPPPRAPETAAAGDSLPAESSADSPREDAPRPARAGPRDDALVDSAAADPDAQLDRTPDSAGRGRFPVIASSAKDLLSPGFLLGRGRGGGDQRDNGE
jgi:hypothetical protein